MMRNKKWASNCPPLGFVRVTGTLKIRASTELRLGVEIGFDERRHVSIDRPWSEVHEARHFAN
jgi:hypothetical protein